MTAFRRPCLPAYPERCSRLCAAARGAPAWVRCPESVRPPLTVTTMTTKRRRLRVGAVQRQSSIGGSSGSDLSQAPGPTPPGIRKLSGFKEPTRLVLVSVVDAGDIADGETVFGRGADLDPIAGGD